jgi:hypothetical protein
MRLIYIHPPKCAGTSVVRALKLRFHVNGCGLSAQSLRGLLREECNGSNDDYVQYEYLANRAIDAVAAHQLTKRTRMVAGHFWYGEYLRRMDRSVLRTTVLRDPVKRFLSHYRFLVWKCGLTLSFDEFLAGERAKQLGSIYGFYFANRYPGNSSDEEGIVNDALETLSTFTVIGDVNDPRVFLKHVKQHIGGFLLSLRSNRTPSKVRPRIASSVTNEQQERIDELTSIDQRIYAGATELPCYCGPHAKVLP